MLAVGDYQPLTTSHQPAFLSTHEPRDRYAPASVRAFGAGRGAMIRWAGRPGEDSVAAGQRPSPGGAPNQVMAELAYANTAISALNGVLVSGAASPPYRVPAFDMRDNECEDPILVLKIQLADLIVRRIAGWTQVNAASLLNTSQPRVSDLRNGRLERFSLEQLVRLVRRVEGFVELPVEWGPRLSSFFNPID